MTVAVRVRVILWPCNCGCACVNSVSPARSKQCLVCNHMQVYVEDALHKRAWVDSEHLSHFVQQIETAFDVSLSTTQRTATQITHTHTNHTHRSTHRITHPPPTTPTAAATATTTAAAAVHLVVSCTAAAAAVGERRPRHPRCKVRRQRSRRCSVPRIAGRGMGGGGCDGGRRQRVHSCCRPRHTALCRQ